MRIMIGRLLAVIIATGLAAMGLVIPAPAYAQSGYDRPGGDFLSFSIRSGDPAVCAARCEREGRCRAWSFSYPGTVAPSAMCWLKSQVTPRVANDCCVSGVRGAAVLDKKSDTVEFSMDRTGGDYKNLDVATDPAGATCEAACKAEDRCRAWTYVRPGYLGTSARCFLKERITRPRHKPCCVSGVVR
jgi:hypothetical protein